MGNDAGEADPKCSKVRTKIPIECKQYASEIYSFSSQYAANNTIGYSASNILDRPSFYPIYGDNNGCCSFRTYGTWWKKSPENLNTASHHRVCSKLDDYLEVGFPQKVYLNSITLYEIYNPGALFRILAKDDDAESEKGKWFVMWTMQKETLFAVPKQSRAFTPCVPKPPFITKTIRLEFCHDNLDYYTGLDAVEINGCTDFDVDEFKEDSIKNIPNPESSTANASPAENGPFDKLPSEVMFNIFSYLSASELAKLASVSHLFYEHSYNPHLPCYQYLDLKPYWHKIDKYAVSGFIKKCCKVKSLSMSWCDNLNNLCPSFLELIRPSLLSLELSCCPMTDDVFMQIAKCCASHGCLQELDVSSTYECLSPRSLQTTALITSLKRIDLYRTKADDHTIITIAKLCPYLEFVNLGACDYIMDYDRVVKKLCENCPALKGLDLWRAQTLTSVGVLYLAEHCHNLISLDIGWCLGVLAIDTNCIQILAKSCRKLKKLFLTSNRSITDADLSALATYCPMLEQLDLLGNSSITFDAVKSLLFNLNKLQLLDVSYCVNVSQANYQELVKLYPHCNIKKSFSPV